MFTVFEIETGRAVAEEIVAGRSRSGQLLRWIMRNTGAEVESRRPAPETAEAMHAIIAWAEHGLDTIRHGGRVQEAALQVFLLADHELYRSGRSHTEAAASTLFMAKEWAGELIKLGGED